MSGNDEAVRAIEVAISRLDAEWELKRGALEDALVVLRGGEPRETRQVVKRRTAEENDADVIAYLRQSSDFTDFTEAEVAHATNIAQASVQSCLHRFEEQGWVTSTDERRHGRGHTRVSKVWRVVQLPPVVTPAPEPQEPEAIA